MQLEENIRVSITGLLDHKIRTFLTMLGIIFGVAAVIAMLSIGEGAKRQALAKFKDLGVNNIIIRDRDLNEEQLQEVRARFSAGLSMTDANAIIKVVPMVTSVSPQAELESEARYYDKSSKVTVIGVTPQASEILNIKISKGDFISPDHYERCLKVCVLGASAAKTLFSIENPIGKQVKIDDQWLEVIGVMGQKSLFTETVGELAARDLNNDIYIPLSTFQRRFPKKDILQSELKQITVKVKDSGKIVEVAEIIRRVIDRHHFNNDDYSLIIPYELLKQEEKERKAYNFLLGSIAAISLLVGGIGIMNIMLASILERTREIGVRRAIGAKKKDIQSQFLTEAVVISFSGGLIGVILGLSVSLIINLFTDVQTNVTFFSVFIAFTVSVLVGIIFGYLPARNAANLNPIESIRYE
ncbi:MAG: ABC transporter permease [Bacteroidales bacterium]|nr:ABC transporter permease [Bacteroidales bacterium]MBN2817848.1 ABC transporter permease [Bacteroidales bacterium]